MGFLWWGRKKEEEVSDLKEELKHSFSNVKDDFKKTGDWLKHLHTRDTNHENSLKDLNSRVSSLEIDMEEIKRFISFFGPRVFKQLSKQPSTGVVKQTAVEGVQTRVQTAVQEGFLRHLTLMERAIIWVLVNAEMKLSYDDIASVLGKERSTIRGQINSIRQKSEDLVEEIIEKNGKKRVYIPEHMKSIVFREIKLPRKSRGRAGKEQK